MVEQIRIRELEEDEITEVRALVSAVFDQFVAPLFSDEGISEFKSFIDPLKLIERLRSNSFILAAEIDVEIVGVIGVRDWSHVFLLFIRGDHQGKGVEALQGGQARPEEDHGEFFSECGGSVSANGIYPDERRTVDPRYPICSDGVVWLARPYVVLPRPASG